MDRVTVRANVPLPELRRGDVGTLTHTPRVAGLLASRRLTLVEATDDPPRGTVAEIVAWVRAGDDVAERADRALRFEAAREGQPRSTLVAQLEQLGAPGRDESAGATPEG